MSIIGSGSTRNVTEIRSFLSAKSADGLVRAQLLNNMKYGVQFSYTDFCQSPVDKKWYCWFLIDIENITPISVKEG